MSRDNLGFDNSNRLKHDSYVFSYKDTQFKLIQNKFPEHSDVLIFLSNAHDSDDFNRVCRTAIEFLSCLCWEHDSCVAVNDCCGFGASNTLDISTLTCRLFTPTTIPSYCCYGYDIHRIPDPTSQDQWKALALYREASGSNSPYMKFLFYWQILDIAHGSSPASYIDKELGQEQYLSMIDPTDLKKLGANSQPLGVFLKDRYRHAIAHVTRYPGRPEIDFYSLHDRGNTRLATHILKTIVRKYIINKLALSHTLYLYPKNGIPTFMSDLDIRRLILRHGQ